MTNNKPTDSREHNLKILPEYYAAVVAGLKRAELRVNDRDYHVGDTLTLNEWDIAEGAFTGEFVSVSVTHIATLPAVKGWVLLSFELQQYHEDEQRRPNPVMAQKCELGFLGCLEKIIQERDEDIDIGQLGRENYECLMIASVDAFRAAFQLPGNSEHVSQPYKLPFDEWLSQQNAPIDVDCGCVSTEALMHWMRVAYEAGNSPVIPDGYALVPVEPTYQMCEALGAKWESPEPFPTRYRRMIAAAPQQEVKL